VEGDDEIGDFSAIAVALQTLFRLPLARLTFASTMATSGTASSLLKELASVYEQVESQQAG